MNKYEVRAYCNHLMNDHRLPIGIPGQSSLARVQFEANYPTQIQEGYSGICLSANNGCSHGCKVIKLVGLAFLTDFTNPHEVVEIDPAPPLEPIS